MKEQLTELINGSKDLLSELRGDSPSEELLNTYLDKRQIVIDNLGTLSEKYHIDQMPAEEIESIKTMFEKFSELNFSIRETMTVVLDKHKQDLISAQSRRKAEDGYKVLGKPDISYF